MDSSVFWISLYLFPLLWILLALTAFIQFKFSWLLIVVVGVSLNGANLVGYFKCDKDAKKRLAQGLGGNVFNMVGMFQ